MPGSNRIGSRAEARALAARLRRVVTLLRQGVFAAGCLLAIASLAGPHPANAQTPPIEKDLPKPDANQPMLLQADEMIYDNQNNRVTARGNVEIYYGTYTLLADKVIYDRTTQQLIAEGNVSIKEPDGAVINADRIVLTDDFRDGFIASLRIVTQDDARIVAARATRQEGEVTTFEQAAFTPCKPCEENPEAPPTWQIRATKVIHRKTEATITYENAVFDLFGYPIAWLPWFKHADPSVKRKSGFLIPTISSSDSLGTTVEVPYYFALAPNYDFTFSPMYTSEQGILWKGRWRHRTVNGRYDIELAGIDQQDPNAAFSTSDRSFRGSIKSEGLFSINQYWEWGWDVTAETDDTFRRVYNLDSILATDRISEVFVHGQRGRNWFSASAYNFGGLLRTDTSTAESWVHPIIDYNYIYGEPVLGGELSFDTNILSFTSDDGTDSARFIAQAKWRRTFIDGLGQVVTPFTMARGDYYSVSDVVDPITGFVGEKSNITRGMALGGVEYRYPFIGHFANAAHVIEPVAQIIGRTDVGEQENIPNEDAQSLVFDDTLLFDIDKFSGYDRLESGSRANVGVRYTMQAYNGGYMRAVFGQSHHLGGDNDFQEDSGLDTTASDYVAGLYVQPINYFSVIAQGRFDEDSFDLKRTDLGARANYGPVAAHAVYAAYDAQPGLGIPTARSEVQTGGSLALAENWSVFGSIRYDLELQTEVADSMGIRYHDDCFALSVIYTETFIRDRDIEPNQQVMLRFELKHLGAFDVDGPSL